MRIDNYQILLPLNAAISSRQRIEAKDKCRARLLFAVVRTARIPEIPRSQARLYFLNREILRVTVSVQVSAARSRPLEMASYARRIECVAAA